MRSFVLPISNPANLVVYGKHLPALLPWLRTFLLPSVCSILAPISFFAGFGAGPGGRVQDVGEAAELTTEGRLATWGIIVTGVILIGASGFGLDLGLPTCISAAVAVLVVTRAKAKNWPRF